MNEITIQGAFHCVYHCIRDDEVIYVGCTSQPDKREKAQRDRLKNITFKVVAVFENRRHAYAYESSEIRRLRPVNNRQGNPNWDAKRGRWKEVAA